RDTVRVAIRRHRAAVVRIVTLVVLGLVGTRVDVVRNPVLIAIRRVLSTPPAAELRPAVGRLGVGVEDRNVRSYEGDDAKVRSSVARKDGRARAGADPPVIGGSETHATFEVDLDGRVARRERRISDDAIALDASLPEDRAADAILAVLQRHEGAERPAPLVAD